MKRHKWLIILLNFIILMVYFNYSIVKKEELLKNGRLVLLELAPVDPRSLMQGDYMALSYGISRSFEDLSKRGYCVVRLDHNGVADKVRFQDGLTPLNEGEYLIGYTLTNEWSVNIGAESFFFQEGHAERYERAKYGGVKIDDKGNSLLVGLYDEQFQKIE